MHIKLLSTAIALISTSSALSPLQLPSTSLLNSNTSITAANTSTLLTSRPPWPQPPFTFAVDNLPSIKIRISSLGPPLCLRRAWHRRLVPDKYCELSTLAQLHNIDLKVEEDFENQPLVPSGLHRTWKFDRDENGASLELWTQAEVHIYQLALLMRRLYGLQAEHGLRSIPGGSMSIQGVEVLRFELALRG